MAARSLTVASVHSSLAIPRSADSSSPASRTRAASRRRGARAGFATSVVLPDGEQIWNHVVLRPLGGTADNFIAAREQYELQHPMAERAARQAAMSARLLDEEFARWS